MAKGILGRKIGMTQVFNSAGRLIPVTVVEAGPCLVVQKKTEDKEGYSAIQLGFDEKKAKHTTQPMKGHFTKAGVKALRFLKEIRLSSQESEQYKVGQTVTVDLFKEGERVDVVGTAKGKGFAGVIKRYNFHRGPMAHGSNYHRGPGSLGATGPARVFKGTRLPGRKGGHRVTIQGLEIIKVDLEKNLLLIKGAIPGRNGALVLINETVKASSK
ncbi:MAG TPA: 50S ribosomal protein L3 [Firmicutes bacterium]|nr:50S ribosomal protein L3 [Bacillota bacterium]HBT15437.1 50S ribosomal protein L3 [Bacillota bacterium]